MADPVTLGMLAMSAVSAGTAAYGASQMGGAGASPPAATAPPPIPPPIQSPQGTRNGATSTAPGGGAVAPSFIGSSALPQQQGYGQKSLLGQ